MTNVVRNILALLASLVVGIVCTQAIARGALALAGSSGPQSGVVVAGILANVFVVPLAAGFVLGLIARGALLPLSVASVVLSLLAAFITLGAAGLPDWSKVFTYIFQWTLLYLAARFGARLAARRGVIAEPSSRGE